MRAFVSIVVMAIVLSGSFGRISLAKEQIARPPAASSEGQTPRRDRQTCCKVCSKGKACGNACISRRYTVRARRSPSGARHRSRATPGACGDVIESATTEAECGRR